MLYLEIRNNDETVHNICYLLWMFRQKNWTNFSLFSSWSSMNLQRQLVNTRLMRAEVITWPWSPSWRASSGLPPSWARCTSGGRRRRRGRWDREGPTGSRSCRRCSRTSRPSRRGLAPGQVITAVLFTIRTKLHLISIFFLIWGARKGNWKWRSRILSSKREDINV